MTGRPDAAEPAVEPAVRPWIPLAGAVAAGTLWVVLSMATGLIFHFMPAAPMLVAVWVRRALGPNRPIPTGRLATDLIFGLVVAGLAGAVVSATGGSFDEGWLIALVVIIGAAIAIWLGRRSR